ncbi:hypothetical protein JB92DRAFT_3146178 [Gautieria morchelliformis]|nr:hypothetical protein JB92DRAFT_3146178 [Gautieria morchelliformis]
MSIPISMLTTFPIAVAVVDDTLALVVELGRVTNITSDEHHGVLVVTAASLLAVILLVLSLLLVPSLYPAPVTPSLVPATPAPHAVSPLQLLIDDIVTGAVELRTGATLKGVVDWRGVYDVPQAFEQAQLHWQGASSASSRIVIIPGALYMTVLLRWARWMMFPPAQRNRQPLRFVPNPDFLPTLVRIRSLVQSAVTLTTWQPILIHPAITLLTQSGNYAPSQSGNRTPYQSDNRILSQSSNPNIPDLMHALPKSEPSNALIHAHPQSVTHSQPEPRVPLTLALTPTPPSTPQSPQQ